MYAAFTMSHLADRDDLEWFIQQALASASSEKLRRLACQCCRRLLERFPDDWPTQVFANETEHPGGHVSPGDWPGQVVMTAVQTAEAFCSNECDAAELGSMHDRAKAVAQNCYAAWRWADAKLGDSATGAEYEVGLIAWHVASVASHCCSDDIHSSIFDCIRHTIDALSFRWRESDKAAAIKGERKAMAEMIRIAIARVT